MQPYLNPNYFNSYQPPVYQYQYQQPSTITGKLVNNFNEITANDVPMNGNPAVFAKADKSEIQLREWNPNGQIVTTLYKPYFEPKQDETNNLPNAVQQPLFDPKTDVLDPIFDKLSELEQQVAKLSNIVAKPTSKTKAVTE